MNDTIYLAHHGTKGMKWGNRKYQNADGSLTPLGRIHYGVGQAREAVRKKVKPTNAELNAQIRKQKSKNLNKQKRAELKALKKGQDSDSYSSSSKKNPKGQHQKFSEMSDQDIQNRINRLRSEVTLAELEATKNMGPGQRFIYEAVKKGASQGISNLVANKITKQGEYRVQKWIDEAKKADADKAAKKDKSNEAKKDRYQSEIDMLKAKNELADIKKKKGNSDTPDYDALMKQSQYRMQLEKESQARFKTRDMLQDAADRERGVGDYAPKDDNDDKKKKK